MEKNKSWLLLGRLHINGRNPKNSWKELKKYIRHEITVLESTKAFIYIHKNKVRILKDRLRLYNKKHHTDFFVE